MSAPSSPATEPVRSRADLVAHLEGGCKPREDWRIGTEHEKFVFRKGDLARPAYGGERGIRAVFEGLCRFGWDPVYEGEALVALSRPDGSSVTFEPGGQIELSGAMLSSLHDTCSEVHTHLHEIRTVGDELGVGLVGLGFDPKWPRADVPWMPKGRYQIMRDYMPKKGALGIDMMIRTCTVQVNLDFSSEADMVKKLRVSLALQPVVTAIFANSPFTEGRPNGFESYRSHAWTDTDPDRCGMLPFAFEDGMGFERYVDYALDVPMYFVYRDGRYVDASGQSFRDFLDGALPALPGERPTVGDWADHLTTIFPEVRLKRFLEERGADGGPWRRLCALPALWVGLLYDDDCLAAAWDLVSGWSAAERAALHEAVARTGLSAAGPGSRTVLEVGREVVALARRGLEGRARIDSRGRSEAQYLETLEEILERGESPAACALRLYHGAWGGSVDPLYAELAY